jgi:hypothetical protein
MKVMKSAPKMQGIRELSNTRNLYFQEEEWSLFCSYMASFITQLWPLAVWQTWSAMSAWHGKHRDSVCFENVLSNKIKGGTWIQDRWQTVILYGYHNPRIIISDPCRRDSRPRLFRLQCTDSSSSIHCQSPPSFPRFLKMCELGGDLEGQSLKRWPLLEHCHLIPWLTDCLPDPTAMLIEHKCVLRVECWGLLLAAGLSLASLKSSLAWLWPLA